MKVSWLYTAPLNSTGIPIGLSYLIALAKQNHEVSLFETTFNENPQKDFNQFISQKNPDIIGVHTTSLCLPQAIDLIKSSETKAKVIWGGVGPTVEPEKLAPLKHSVCIGPGEVYLMSALGDKWNGELPIPDWSLFDDRHITRVFKGEIKRWGNFQLSRGCPFSCSYCVNSYYKETSFGRPRMIPVDHIIEEIKHLSHVYNLDIVRIFDECFGHNLTHTRNFADVYKEAISLPSIIETRPEVIVKPGMIQALKDINCVSVSLGIEAGDEDQRKLILNRHVSNGTIIKAFNLLHDNGIRCASYNIIGWPWDTEQLIMRTVNLNKQCKPDFTNWFIATPFPKTRLREYCIKHDLLLTHRIPDYVKESVIWNPLLPRRKLYEIYVDLKNMELE